MKLLLLSNSTNHGAHFFSHARDKIARFLNKKVDSILFIPYAVVSVSFDEYESKVKEVFDELGYQVSSIHHAENPAEAVKEAECIMVGGGNTFHLLNHCYQAEILELVRKKVNEGTPYIGWSAGSNLACPTIKTTNDMPVIEPPSFEALNLVPFQINAHYTEGVVPNHGGESRDQRLEEFVMVNRTQYVVGLPEGTSLQIIDQEIRLIGNQPVKVFKYGLEPKNFNEDQQLDFLWGNI